MKLTYKQVREDFEYIESLCELDDQVEIMANIDEFMRNPTKAYATGLYRSKLLMWFRERRFYGHAKLKDERVIKIQQRYDI